MRSIFLIKQPDGSLRPAYEDDQMKLKRIKMGEAIEVKFSKPRNFHNHRRFFGMLNCVISNMPEDTPNYDKYQNIDYLRGEVLIGIGFCEWRTSLGGVKYPVAKSMSFAAMDEIEFLAMYELASVYLLKHFLRGVEREVFEENINLFM